MLERNHSTPCTPRSENKWNRITVRLDGAFERQQGVHLTAKEKRYVYFKGEQNLLKLKIKFFHTTKTGEFNIKKSKLKG